MHQKLLPLLLTLAMSLPAFSQKPSGERPPKDENEYVGFFDVKPNNVSPDSEEIYSTTDTRARFLDDGELEKFANSFTKMDSLRKTFVKEYVLFSFVVEKDGSTSNVEVWLSDDEHLNNLAYAVYMINDIDDYPGWGNASVSGYRKHVQVWKSKNERLNSMVEKIARSAIWTPATINGVPVRSRVYRHLFF